MKKVLLSTAIALFIIALFVVVPSKVLATFPEGMSEEFKEILNKEGKLVVTDTNMGKDKRTFLNDYLTRYQKSDYNFVIYSGNEDYSVCNIGRNMFTNPSENESYDIEVVYQEKYSDEFKSILKDGKLEILSSSKNDRKPKVSNSVSILSNDKYRFYVVSENGQPLINEDCTKATIKMQENTTTFPQKSEQHVVELSWITEQSKEFKNLLNKNGELEFNSVQPKTINEFNSYFELLIYNEKMMMYYDNLADDFSYCDLTANGETHTVKIVYNYNKDIKQKMQSFINKFPENIRYFEVKDMELINFWVNNIDKEDTKSLGMFSGELKSYLNYNNIEYYVDDRAGEDSPFHTERVGVTIFKYDGVAYYVDDNLGTKADHIIYVPNETENTKEALMEAAQKRIDEYLGKEGIATISYGGTAYDCWARAKYEDKEIRKDWEEYNPNLTFEEFKSMLNVFLPTYENFEEVIGVKGVNENDDAFIITIKVGDKTRNFNIFIKKGAQEKMVTPAYKAADMKTNVEISSASTTIPLDTSIKVEKITSGTEYDRIIKLLDVKENAMFDFKLYSESLEKYITKLEDGTFEVKIPIPDDLKNKNLVAYYVTSNNEQEKFDVEIKDGYAIFKTKHFSVYTLAEKPREENNNNNNNEGNNTNTGNNNTNTGNNNTTNNNTTNSNTNTNNGKNPRTGDNILLFVGMSFIAIIGIAVTAIFSKHYKTK